MKDRHNTSNFLTDKAIGKKAEDAVLAAYAEIGLVPLCTTTIADQIEHTDLFIANTGEDSEPAEGFIGDKYYQKAICPSYVCIDVKAPQNLPEPEDLASGARKLLVEWHSGCKEEATPLSDENSIVTHIAFMRRPDNCNETFRDRPFCLFVVQHLREFYLRHNDGSGQYLIGLKKYPHCVLFDIKQYLTEYSFTYYYKKNGVWMYKDYGNLNMSASRTYCILPPLGCIYASLFSWKHRLNIALAGSNKEGCLLKLCQMNEDQTASMFFNGDKNEMNKLKPYHFDEKYRFRWHE